MASRTVWAKSWEQPGQDKWDRTVGTEQPGHGNQRGQSLKYSSIGKIGPDSPDRTSVTGHLRQVSLNKSALQATLVWTERTGLPGNDGATVFRTCIFSLKFHIFSVKLFADKNFVNLSSIFRTFRENIFIFAKIFVETKIFLKWNFTTFAKFSLLFASCKNKIKAALV
jgi:hypothetical protein